MSLLSNRPVTPDLLPNLSGKEVLVGPDPELAKVKGVMFGGRKAFVIENFGEAGFYESLVGLSPRTLNYARNPIATMWCEFESLVEYDRAIYARWKDKFPHVLALLGAASAELGIGTVYRALDSGELHKFLANLALFHDKYQKFGKLAYEKTPQGARMTYSGYSNTCYSPLFCASGGGFFYEAILRHGGSNPSVRELRCTCRGDGQCTYELTWS